MTWMIRCPMTRRFFQLGFVCTAMAWVWLAGGCVKGGVEAVPTMDDAASRWRPMPRSMRIYPSTQFVRENDVPLLEVRIELRDEMGDSIKSSGSVRCELFASSGRGDGTLGRRLYGWDVELRDLADQRAFYDPIIRGYLFRLKLDNIAPAQQATTLRVTLTPTEGARLTDEVEIVGGESAG